MTIKLLLTIIGLGFMTSQYGQWYARKDEVAVANYYHVQDADKNLATALSIFKTAQQKAVNKPSEAYAEAMSQLADALKFTNHTACQPRISHHSNGGYKGSGYLVLCDFDKIRYG